MEVEEPENQVLDFIIQCMECNTVVTDSTALVFSDQEWLFFSKAVNVTWDENEPYRQDYVQYNCIKLNTAATTFDALIGARCTDKIQGLREGTKIYKTSSHEELDALRNTFGFSTKSVDKYILAARDKSLDLPIYSLEEKVHRLYNDSKENSQLLEAMKDMVVNLHARIASLENTSTRIEQLSHDLQQQQRQ